MSYNLKLSICVPTYNRPEKLRTVLSQLIPQMTSECELIIRDDSDNNKSAQIIKTLTAKKKIKITLFRGRKMGVDLANLFLLERANGEYIWWLSDDDQISDETVNKIISTIKENDDITFIWLNFLSSFSGKTAVTGKHDGFFRNNGEFFDVVGPSMGLLSCLVLQRQKGLPFLQLAKSRQIGFGFAQMVPILGAISENDRIYFLKGPLITNYPASMQVVEEGSKSRDVEQGSLSFEVYAINFPDTLRLFEKNLDKLAIKRLIGRNFSHFWRGFVIGIAKGYDTVRGKRWELMRRYWWHPEFVVAIFLMHLPKSLLNKLYNIYIVMKKKIS